MRFCSVTSAIWLAHPVDDAQVAVAASLAGAAVVRERFGTDVERAAKSETDFATDVDVAAERAIADVLEEHRPHDGIRGEELGSGGASGAERVWLVDPLCGTLNFAARSPGFSVNVALVESGRTLAAAVADPLAGEVYWTDGTRAATRDRSGTDHRMSPSPESRLVDVNLDIDVPTFDPAAYLAGGAFGRLRPRVLSTTLALAWVATGQRVGYVTAGDLRGSVHFTAPIALCAAAGCVVTDLRGRPLPSPDGLIAAADEATHAVLLAGA